MFNNKKIRELEQKVSQLSDLLKIKWYITEKQDSYSPPTVFYKFYQANFIDITKKLLEYFHLEVYEEPAKDKSVSIRKIIKKK